MSWKNFPWRYNCLYNISVWPRYLMTTVLQLLKLFSDSAWDSHIVTFDFIFSPFVSVIEQLVCLIFLETSWKFWWHCFRFPQKQAFCNRILKSVCIQDTSSIIWTCFVLERLWQLTNLIVVFNAYGILYASLLTWPRPKESLKDFGASCYHSTSTTAPRNTNQTKAQISFPSWWD